jgi:hypothetical protein
MVAALRYLVGRTEDPGVPESAAACASARPSYNAPR